MDIEKFQRLVGDVHLFPGSLDEFNSQEAVNYEAFGNGLLRKVKYSFMPLKNPNDGIYGVYIPPIKHFLESVLESNFYNQEKFGMGWPVDKLIVDLTNTYRQIFSLSSIQCKDIRLKALEMGAGGIIYLEKTGHIQFETKTKTLKNLKITEYKGIPVKKILY